MWFTIRQILQNGVESINVVSSMSNSADSTAATSSLIDIPVALEKFALVEDGAVQEH